MRKINQHYVWQEYLKSWSVNDAVACCRNGASYRANTSKVASERLFYQLQELTPANVDFIEAFAIQPSPEALKPIHRAFLSYYRAPWSMKRLLGDSARAEVAAKLDESIANFEEDYQAAIERDFAPILRSMRGGDISFYTDPDKASTFLFSLNVQFLRTKRVREAFAQTPSASRFDLSRCWNVMSHIFAKNAALSFFRDRSQFRLVFVENCSNVPFITGDQPIINLLSNPFTRTPPERMEFYYPLSPHRAMFLLEKSNGGPTEVFSSESQVHPYNVLMTQHAHEQIFSTGTHYLTDLWPSRLQTSKNAHPTLKTAANQEAAQDDRALA